MRVTLTPSSVSGTQLEEAETSLGELAEDLRECPVGEKDGLSIIPAVFRPCPSPCRNTGKPKARVCGVDGQGGAAHRLGANVEAMTAFGVDLDHVTDKALASVLAGLRARGLAFVWWHTYSHAPPSDCRARILIPFAEPFPLKSPAQWSRGAWPMLAKELGLDQVGASADEACRDPARVYYLPRRPSEDVLRESGAHEGKPLDWRPIFGSSLDGFERAAEIAPRPPEEDLSRAVDLEDLRERLKKIKQPSTAALVRNILAGTELVPPPGAGAKRTTSRYSAWRTVTAALSMVADEWMSTDALLEVLRPSWYAEADASPGDHTAWEGETKSVRHLLETARASAPQRKAEREAARQTMEAAWERAVLGKTAPSTPAAPLVTPDATATTTATTTATDTEEDWLTLLEKRDTKDGPQILPTGHNISLLLQHSPEMQGVLRFNRLSREVELHRAPFLPAPYDSQVLRLADWHVTCALDWVAYRHRIPLPPTWTRSMAPRMETVALRNSYDPLVDYLNGLRWDGIPRAAQWLERCYGARVVNDSGSDISVYVRAVSLKFLVSAVARALEPGCKVDTMLHLEGAQGAFKSTSLRVLAGDWFSDEAFDLRNKDSWASAGRKWVIELGELSALNRSDAETQKGFLTRQDDDFRAPYARASEKVARRCVFVGTTNTSEYLNDLTGNRRHWVVSCSTIDVPWLKENRDQLWAEAVHVYRTTEGQDCRWWLTPEEAGAHSAEVEARVTPDSVEEAIAAWFLAMSPESRPVRVTMHEISTQALNQTDPTRGSSTKIGNALARMGFTKHIGTHGRFYRAPDKLLTSPKVGPGVAGGYVGPKPTAGKPAQA